MSVLLAGAASPKDLGTRGETWAIAEPDLLAALEARLLELERSGALAEIEDEARERVRARVEAPEPVAGIAPATEHRTRLVDPSVVLDPRRPAARREPAGRGGDPPQSTGACAAEP